MIWKKNEKKTFLIDYFTKPRTQFCMLSDWMIHNVKCISKKHLPKYYISSARVLNYNASCVGLQTEIWYLYMVCRYRKAHGNTFSLELLVWQEVWGSSRRSFLADKVHLRLFLPSLLQFAFCLHFSYHRLVVLSLENHTPLEQKPKQL